MKSDKITVGILITTTNQGIKRVKEELLPQLSSADEIIISHQIFDEKTKPEKNLTKGNIRYFHLKEKGLSKNRNNALKHSKSDICHICDDDLNYKKDFCKIIKKNYQKFKSYDVITFQAVDENNKWHYYKSKDKKHNFYSILKLSSWGVTFKRKSVLRENIKFDEDYGLGAKWCIGEENIFLKDCLDKGLKLRHCNKVVVSHGKESSGFIYRDELIYSRIKAFKRMYGFLGEVFAVLYFSIFHHKLYKKKYSFFKFFKMSLEGMLK